MLKFSSILEKKSTLQKLKLLKNPSFYFFKIQNLRSQRPKFSGPQSSASSLDLFGKGEQFREIFEGVLCQKIIKIDLTVLEI